jgi:hypothetical protein
LEKRALGIVGLASQHLYLYTVGYQGVHNFVDAEIFRPKILRNY